MVKLTQCLPIAAVLTLLLAGRLHAKDPSTYHAGDRAEEDITAAVPLDVIDPAATAARQAAEAQNVPVIFRSFPDNMTNVLVKNFSAAFALEHAHFLAALEDSFHTPVLDQEAINSPDFGQFVTSFNKQNNAFPVTTELAGLWAKADPGTAVANHWGNTLLDMTRTRRPIRPDTLPDGLVLSPTLWLVPTKDSKQPVTADDVQRGKLITASGITTVTRLRGLYRRTLPDDQQVLAHALQKYLQPNCVADAGATKDLRTQKVSQLVAIAHYDAGQMIVRHGEVIDAKALNALSQLHEKLAPQQLSSQIATERASAQAALAQAQKLQAQAQQAQLAKDEALKARAQALADLAQAAHTRNEWLLAALLTISGAAVLAVWWVTRRRQAVPLHGKLEIIPAPNQVMLPANLAPQLTAILKEAVVQGLAAQRNELLQAQHAAAAEIAELVTRLDKLQAPLQERLQIYEVRIAELQKELSQRSEENRELLKLKIDMIRSQLDTERDEQFRYTASLRGKPFS